MYLVYLEIKNANICGGGIHMAVVSYASSNGSNKGQVTNRARVFCANSAFVVYSFLLIEKRKDGVRQKNNLFYKN